MRKGDVFFYGTIAVGIGTIIGTAREVVRYVDYCLTHPAEIKMYEGRVTERRLVSGQLTFAVETPQGKRTFHVYAPQNDSLDSIVKSGSTVRLEVLGFKGIERDEMYISKESIRN
ncbi:hypothetical protein J4207_03245 [Candidatus Woesearchaeota archaeon]|nr:hypothetical protein [Candidatus Woesearchaeota archaeon]